MAFERSIKFAFDKISGEILEADEIFEKTKDAYIIRKEFNKNKIELYCCECKQKLNVSTSKYDRLHFKHNKYANPCLLKDNKFTPKEKEELKKFYKSNESDRHKQLKNEIARKISKLDGINSINVDSKFIIENKERRKPDVYCKYFDKQLVFEIQLSKLPLRYILNRHEFYKRNEMYLIWILDDFDIHGQSQTERDIKYLTEYQNFFKLDEKSPNFRLLCKYKYSFLTKNNKILTKWTEKSISLTQLKFSEKIYQVYYYDLKKKLELKETEKKQNELKQKEKEKKKEIEEKKRQKLIRLNIAKEKANEIISELRELWKSEIFAFEDIKREIQKLDEFELSVLNNLNAFKTVKGKPKIHQWFEIAKRSHYRFLEFMLDCHYLEINVNEKSVTNKSLVQVLFENKKLEHKMLLLKMLLKRNYKFKKQDEIYIKELNLTEIEIEQTILLCHLSNNLNQKHLIDQLFEFSKVVLTIESAKRNKIVGFGYKPNEWIKFANNSIYSYKKYWEYIELAFRYYGIWDKLILLDKKGTFQNKIIKFYKENPKQKYDCEWLIKFLYPEIIDEKSTL